jgi:hypothetical protein
LNNWNRIALCLLGLLAALALGEWVRLSERLVHEVPALRLEAGRRRQATLTPELSERFGSFAEGVRITYYVSQRSEMPAHLSHLEKGVRDVLGGFERAAETWNVDLQSQVIFPDRHPDWADSLGSAGLAPWRARRVEGDGYREDQVWSSLRIAYGPRPAAVLNGVGPAQVLELQNLILEQLEELRSPRRPRVVLSGPAEGYDELRRLLNTGASVTEIDFDEDPRLPAQVDLFLWLDPTRVEERHLAVLDGLRARGASLVLAGRGIHSTERALDETMEVRFEPGAPAMGSLLRHHGLSPVGDLLLDPSAGERLALSDSGGESVQQFVPWYVRSTANNQDFRTLYGQPNGSLLFRTPSAFYPAPARLAELGLEATVLASAGNFASMHELPKEPMTTEQVFALKGQTQPNVALAALLRPADPWGGQVMVLSDSAIFGDEHWYHDHYAHQAFAQVLLTSLLSSERLVAGRLALRAPGLLPELTSEERIAWRGLVVLAIPAALAVAFLLRGRRSGYQSRNSRPWSWVLGSTLVCLPLLQGLSLVSQGLDADLTEDGRNRLTPAQQVVFAEQLREPTEFEFIFSPPAQLPPQFKPLVRELRRACERLADRFDTLEITSQWTDALSPAETDALKAKGIRPLAVSSAQTEATRMFRIYGSLQMRRGSHEVTLNFPSERSFGHLHFRLAHALERLESAAPTRVALFAEPPRISPAEASMEYQRKGLFAPREGDAYSAAEEFLKEFDFEVLRLEAGRDQVPEDLNALLWMQPRRDLLPMLQALSQHLHRGGGALVAGQHFRVLSRQLEGTALQQRFWPEPQFFDLDRHYLPELGIEVPRLVCFDNEAGTMNMKTRVDGTQGLATYKSLPTSQDFLVQPSSEGLAGLHGQWLMPFATQVRWSPELLEKNNLRVTPWIHGGQRPWTYAWSGGDLPQSVLANDSTQPEGLADRVEQGTGPACYAALFSGTFPAAQVTGQEQRQLMVDLEGKSSEEGRLLLMGNSELFKNEQLGLRNFDHEDLLLRAVSTLALPPRLLPLLDRPRHEPTLEAQEDGTRRFWRIIVLGAPAALLLAVGLMRRRAA